MGAPRVSVLIKAAKELSPRVVSISDTTDLTTEMSIEKAAASAELPHVNPIIPTTLKLGDGIHYSNAAYQIWLPALEAAVVK